MENKFAQCMTITSIIEFFGSITLCTITFYLNPQIMNNTILGIMIIYYGYLAINLLVFTLVIVILIILVTIPFVGVNQSIKFTALAEPCKHLSPKKISYYVYPIFYCFVFRSNILFLHLKLIWSILENAEAIYQYCFRFSFNASIQEQQVLSQIRNDVYQRYNQYV